ncbi:hypothetical protein CTTA_4576 [Comamonas testosteroni]|uniref:Uncharacterized protein n=1 Tax=Comamonas testosteroni TaxID=285 RepID=A0A5A7MKX4_COMTE|nr:hypothetical protein [Comamonas testosteroni]GEQ77571.1 hypothetical protein CTTA_4576 [Comamonas testosteroni]
MGLHNDQGEKKGQIAHLDRCNQNSDIDNLMFMCLLHHNEYDSIQSQAVGFTIGEAKEYRARVEELVTGERIIWTKREAQRFIYDHINVVSYIQAEKARLAVEHETSFMDALFHLTSNAHGLYGTCFHKGVRKVYERMGEGLTTLCELLSTDEYIEMPTRRKFNNKSVKDKDVQAILLTNMEKVGQYADVIEAEFKLLQQFAQDKVHIGDDGVAQTIGGDPIESEPVNAPGKKGDDAN